MYTNEKLGAELEKPTQVKGNKNVGSWKELLAVLMCPNSREKLSLIKREELIEIFKDRIKEFPEGYEFLINESKSIFYRISETGLPILVPEEAFSAESIPESISAGEKNSKAKISFETLKKHKGNLKPVYKKLDGENTPYTELPEKIKWKSRDVHKPLADNLNPGSVLDVGGGMGLFRYFTKGRFHLNVDVTESRLNQNPAPYNVNGRSECIPVRDNIFDNVISSRSMEHCQDPTTSMKELVRCLKPGGKLCVTCWREDWPACQKNTVWAITNFYYFLYKVFKMAKHNPDLLLDRALYKLKLKKTKSYKYVKNIWGDEDLNKIFSRRYNRDAFQKMLENAGVEVIKKGYSGKDFPGFEPPQFLVDKFFDPSKYGSFFYFICRKPTSQT